ncbi:MAG: LLM class flavin-dependent oxidoreductase [Pseudomonadales bacterium]|nr:LLM class flavin-dependent oxidoreductase [Pseudomonadales bacterium]
MPNHRLGLVLSTVTDAPPQEFVELGKLAEARGFDAMLVNEGAGDALANAIAIGAATSTIKVGTNIANIYFRHPFLAAMTAWTITEMTAGRLIFGLGMSHRAVLRSLGIEMKKPRQYLREYAWAVKHYLTGQQAGEQAGGLSGEARKSAFKARPTSYPAQVLVAALTPESAAVGGAVADGIMPFLTGRGYINTLLAAARKAASEVDKDPAGVDCIMSIPTFLSTDVAAARSAARYNLAFFGQMPNYRKQWRACGYEEEVIGLEAAWKQRDRRLAATKVSDRMIEEVCVFGTASQCRDQLAAFYEAGASMPLLAVSPVNEDRLVATHKAIEILAPNSN